MKIALFAGGSFYGDVGPYIEIGRQLKQLGHNVLLVIPEEYSNKNIDLETCFYMGDVLTAENENTASNYGAMIFGIMKNLLQNAFDRIDSVLAACQDCDVILSHPLCAISDVVADYYGIKNIELLISSMYFNDEDNENKKHFLNSIGLDALNNCRAKLELPLATSVSVDIFSNNNTKITLFPDFYVSTKHSNVIYGNFIHYEDVIELPRELLDFIEAGDPPIVFAMGSGSKHMMDPPNFNEITVEVSKKYRSVLLGKSDIVHENVFVCDVPVPHSKLFPLASIVVTHGGIGTIGKCLEYNIPQIAVPQMVENRVNADLMSHLISVVYPENYTEESIASVIDSMNYDYKLGVSYSEKIKSINVIDIILKTINN